MIDPTGKRMMRDLDASRDAGNYINGITAESLEAMLADWEAWEQEMSDSPVVRYWEGE